MSDHEAFLRKCRRVAALSAVLRGLTEGLIAAGGAGVLAFLLGPAVVPLLLAVFLFFLGNRLRPLVRLRGDRLALAVDGAFPVLKEGAINSVQLSREARSGRTPYSRPLIQSAIVKAEERMRGLNPWDIFRGRDIMRSTLVLLLILCVYGVLHGRVRAAFVPPSVSGQGSVLVADIIVTYRFPAYASLPQKTEPRSTGDISGVKGTEVEMRARTISPVKEGRLMFDKGKEIPLTVSEDGRLSGRFVIMEDDSYRFSLIDRRGRRSHDALSHRVTADEDSPPEVEIISPADGLVVRQGDNVRIVYRARDDFGLGPVSLVVRTDTGEKKYEAAHPPDGSREYQGSYLWSLADPSLLVPGNRVSYAVEALDNDTISGPKAGRSRFFTIVVYSQAKKHEELMVRVRRLFESSVSTLGDEILLSPASLKKEALLIEIEKSSARIRSLIRGIDEIVSEGKDDPYLDETFMRALSGMAGGLRGVSARKRTPDSLPGLQGKVVSALEDGTIGLDDLLRRQDLRDALERGRSLLSHDDLLAALENLKNGTGDARALMDAIEKAKTDLAALYEKISTMAADAPDEYLNAEAMKDLHATDLLEELGRIKERLDRGDTEGALQAARSYLNTLNQLMASLENMTEGSFSSGHPEALSRLSAAERDLDDLSAQQKGLAEDTMKTSRGMRTSALGRKKEDLDRFVEKERQKVSRLKTLLPPHPGIMSDVVGCDSALARKDLQEAYQRSLRSLGGLKSVESGLGPYPPGGMQGRGNPQERLRNAMAVNEEISRDLKDILYPGPESLAGRDRENISTLAKRQGSIKKKAEDIAGRLPARDDSSFLPEGLPDKVREAARAMGESEESLKGMDPFSAQLHEETAVQKLSEARDALEKAKQGYSLGALRKGASLYAGGNQGIMGAYSGRVDLPARDAYKVPGVYRDEILKAMEDGLPEKYRDMNKDYFERLLK